MSAERGLRILAVDDLEEDIELLRAAIHRLPERRVEIIAAYDGVDALARLEELDASDARPDLAIVDLKMPRLDGQEFTRAIRADPVRASLPILILSTSRDPDEIASCYHAGCNAYFRKPLEFADLVELMHAVIHHWAELVSLPGR